MMHKTHRTSFPKNKSISFNLYSTAIRFGSISAIFILFTLLSLSAFAQKSTIVLSLNTVQTLPLPDNTGSILIGNPAIANVTLEAGRLVIVGLGLGQTNLLIASETGQPLLSRTILVTAPQGNTVTIRKGGKAAQAYLCAPRCEAPAAETPGDALRRPTPAPRED